ncbi:hypothetical protein [Flavobacterium sp. H122]|uniref:hypothetical protein n=1 Tax=Flavobacterium sp. H122 TaxID=2529860 RepID=UPI0010AAE7A7|nr:hypothetical protein [Flavobacterium sp. H122]
MKKKFFTFLGLVTLISCQNEEIKTKSTDESGFTAFKKEWINSKLESSLSKNDGNTICYLFPKNDLTHLQENVQLRQFRFVLGLTDGKLDLKTEGVDTNGKSLGIINSVINTDQKISHQVNELSLSKRKFNSDNELMRKHLLIPNLAFDYINKWNKKLIEKKDINTIVSYDGVRINHFSIEKEVIDEISKSSKFEYLGILLGINSEGKLTTVMLGLDKEKNFVFFSSSTSKYTNDDPEAIYDFSKPCPNTCDPQ